MVSFRAVNHVGVILHDHRHCTHLPQCTGWDWKPPVPPPGFRLMQGEETISEGDYFLSNYNSWNRSFNAGRKVSECTGPTVLAYACKLEPPKPTFRPFKDAAEYEPFKNDWLARTDAGNRPVGGKWRPMGFCDVGIYPGGVGGVMTYKEALEQTLFINDYGDTRPFGVEE